MVETNQIPYFEYRAIIDLSHAHQDDNPEGLRALIAFGDLLTLPGSYDIDLLEVVQDWNGPHRIAFQNSKELPLRGTLRLSLLTVAQFENTDLLDPAERRWAENLLSRIRQSHEVIYEHVPGYVKSVLQDQREFALSSAASPLHLLKRP